MISMSINVKQITEDLQLNGEEYKLFQKRALADALRRLRTIGRKEARRRTNLKASSVNRRINAYPKRSKLWFGGRNALVTSKVTTRTKSPGRIKDGSRQRKWGRSVIDDGKTLEGAFLRREGKIANVPARRYKKSNSVQPVMVRIRKDMLDSFRITEGQAAEIIEAEFNKYIARKIKREVARRAN